MGQVLIEISLQIAKDKKDPPRFAPSSFGNFFYSQNVKLNAQAFS